MELLLEPFQRNRFRSPLRLRLLRRKLELLDKRIHRRRHRVPETLLQPGGSLRIQLDVRRYPRLVVVNRSRRLGNQFADLLAELVGLVDITGHLRVTDRGPYQQHQRHRHGKTEHNEQHQIVFDKSIHSLSPSYFLTGSFSLRRISNEVRFNTSVSCSYLSRIEPSSSFEKYFDFLIFCCNSFSSRSRPLSTSV